MLDSTVRTHGRLGSLWRYALAGTISLVAWAVTAIGFAEADINDQPIVGWFLVGDGLLGVTAPPGSWRCSPPRSRSGP